MGRGLLAALLAGLAGAMCAQPEWADSSALALLWQAASARDTDRFFSLLVHSRDVALHRAGDGRGPLFWAYEFKHVKALALLSHLGADEEAQDLHGKRPRQSFPDGPKQLQEFLEEAHSKVDALPGLLNEQGDDESSTSEAIDADAPAAALPGRLLRERPEDADLLSKLGVALAQEEDDTEGAIASLQRAIELEPEQPTHVLRLAQVWRHVGLPLLAADTLRQVVAEDAEEVSAHLQLAEILWRDLGDAEAALPLLRRATALAPERADGWNLLGTLLYEEREYAEAVKALERSAAAAPDDAAMRANLAAALRASGDFARARAEFALAAEVGGELDQSMQYHYAKAETAAEAGVEARAGAGALEDVATWTVRAPGAQRLPLAAALGTIHCVQLIDEPESAWLVATAEAAGGWSEAGHHDDHPTVDVVVAEVPELLEWLNRKLRLAIWPTLARQFDCDEGELWLEDAFVVRYEPSGQSGLGLHRDGSELSFNLLLSDQGSFEGGGTFFETLGEAGETLRPQRGQMLSHWGRLRHAGQPVLSGVRYILAGFVRVERLAAAWEVTDFGEISNEPTPTQECQQEAPTHVDQQ